MGLRSTELIIILVIILVLFGGSRLPKLARSLGQAQREFKQGSDEEDGAVPEAGTPGRQDTSSGHEPTTASDPGGGQDARRTSDAPPGDDPRRQS